LVTALFGVLYGAAMLVPFGVALACEQASGEKGKNSAKQKEPKSTKVANTESETIRTARELVDFVFYVPIHPW